MNLSGIFSNMGNALGKAGSALGNAGNKLSNGINSLQDLLASQQGQEQGQMTDCWGSVGSDNGGILSTTIDNTVKNVPQYENVLTGAINKEVNTPQPQKADWKTQLQQASKTFAENAYANSNYNQPQQPQYKISGLQQLQYAPNKQYLGLSNLLKQVKGY